MAGGRLRDVQPRVRRPDNARIPLVTAYCYAAILSRVTRVKSTVTPKNRSIKIFPGDSSKYFLEADLWVRPDSAAAVPTPHSNFTALWARLVSDAYNPGCNDRRPSLVWQAKLFIDSRRY